MLLNFLIFNIQTIQLEKVELQGFGLNPSLKQLHKPLSHPFSE